MSKYIVSIMLTLSVSVYGLQDPYIVTNPLTDVQGITYIFAHGLASTHRQALHTFCSTACLQAPLRYNPYWMIGTPALLFDFADAKSDNKIQWHAQHVNLGQEYDVEALQRAYEYGLQHYPGNGFILGGVSRGAATILNFLGTAKPAHIKAAVLECPFDSFEGVVNHLLHQVYVDWIPYSEKLAKKYMAYMFPRIKTAGLVPKQVVHTISHAIPILLLHAKSDNTVPINASRNLYNLLRAAGHERVHLCEVQTGLHARLLKGPEAKFTHSVIQAFYKHYNLPHDAIAADFAYTYFVSHCQPEIKEVKKAIKQTRMLMAQDIQQEQLLLQNVE